MAIHHVLILSRAVVFHLVFPREPLIYYQGGYAVEENETHFGGLLAMITKMRQIIADTDHMAD